MTHFFTCHKMLHKMRVRALTLLVPGGGTLCPPFRKDTVVAPILTCGPPNYGTIPTS